MVITVLIRLATGQGVVSAMTALGLSVLQSLIQQPVSWLA